MEHVIRICNCMRPSRIKGKFSRVFSKFSQNFENFENTSENFSLILRGLNAITCLQHRGQNFLKTFHAHQNTIRSRPSE